MDDGPAPEESERDSAFVLDMILAAEDALSFTRELDEAAFLDSRLHQNAVIRSLEVIGEAAGKLSARFRASHGEFPWREITGMRHRLVHDYAGVRLDLVWRAARERLPALLAVLRPLAPPPEND
ncbi:MAG: HepT-like ribonuclease domain-containing protein [Caulobacteraceae bacterium]